MSPTSQKLVWTLLIILWTCFIGLTIHFVEIWRNPTVVGCWILLDPPLFEFVGEGVLISMDKRYYMYTEIYYLSVVDPPRTYEQAMGNVTSLCTAIGENCVGLALYREDVRRFVLSYQEEEHHTMPKPVELQVNWIPVPGTGEEWRTRQRPHPRISSKVVGKGWDGWDAYYKVSRQTIPCETTQTTQKENDSPTSPA
jgi:hypothetical protein